MPLGKELKKAWKKTEKETQRVVKQVETEVKKVSNDHDNNVHNIKEMLSSLGINHENREIFDIGMPHPLNPLNEQEPIKYRWIASTSNSGGDNQEKGEQAKSVLKALVEAKRSSDANNVTNEFIDHFSKLNLNGVVSFMNTATKLGIYTYGSVVPALNALPEEYYPAKLNDVATEALFTKYNITYPQFWSRIAPNTDLINEINSFYEQENFTTNQAALVAKVFREGLHCKLLNDVTDEFKNDFPKLDLNGVATLMHILKAKEENIDGAVSNSLPTNYPATWENIPTKDFLAKYNITNSYRSFEDKIGQEEVVKLTGGEYSYLDTSFQA